MSTFVTATKGPEDIAGLKGSRGTSTAGGKSNIFEGHEERFTFNIGEGDVDATRVVTIRVSIESGVFEGEKARKETARKLSYALGIIL